MISTFLFCSTVKLYASSDPVSPPPIITTFSPIGFVPSNASTAVITCSAWAPGTFNFLAVDPVATNSSSTSIAFIISGVTSVFKCTFTPVSFICFSYHFINFLSSSLKSIEAAETNTPHNLSVFSYKST